MRNEHVTFRLDHCPDLGSEMQHEGRSVVVVQTKNFLQKFGYVEVSGIYGHSKDGLITGLTCEELAVDGMDGHEWQRVISIHNDFEVFQCRWCGAIRETEESVDEAEREKAQAEIAIMRVADGSLSDYAEFRRHESYDD